MNRFVRIALKDYSLTSLFTTELTSGPPPTGNLIDLRSGLKMENVFFYSFGSDLRFGRPGLAKKQKRNVRAY
jgi:hypothetical protein